MSLPDYILNLLKLSIPIIIGQLGQMLIVAGDVYIATMFSTKSVASIGLASGFINPIFLFGIGLMMGISPSLAVLRGEGKDEKKSLSSVLVYSAVVGLVLTLLMLFLNQFVHLFGIDEALIPSIRSYISIVSWSFPFAIIFQGLKEYLQSFEKVIIPNLMSIIAVFLNLVINYVLVFGVFEFAGIGETGLAVASLLIRFILCLCMVIYVFKDYKLSGFCLDLTKHIFNFSLPIAFMFFLEVLAFCVVTILSGNLGIIEAATNNIIMTIASIAFMIPLSISSAVAVKVGYAYGLKDKKMLLGYLQGAIVCAFVYIFFSANIFFLFSSNIMHFMTADLAVIELGIKLLFIVALFQLADGIQVVLSGILRGLDDTKSSSYLVFVGYWVIGIPFGIYLTFYRNFGCEGLWAGLAVSLLLVALTLSVLTNKRYREFVHQA
ncbi:MAG: MATE family efflux transporter [Halobacteriovoraceae bacterium]|jgi:multidrug resistance protein, MATE family|nr:MATE family efflux transporter [Halobacteriovoraceae bacterium]